MPNANAPDDHAPGDEPGEQRYSLAEFVRQTGQRDRGEGLFELESPRLLELNLGGANRPAVWTKTGSMVAYVGAVRFTREGLLDQGIGGLLKKAVSGEGARLTKAEGLGRVYLADAGKKVSVLRLRGRDSIVVNGNDLLAFEPDLTHEITMMRKVAAVVSGGLFNVRVSGDGLVAITTHYDPLTLRVPAGGTVFTDPNATVAWSGGLSPELKTDVSLKTFLGRGSGESIQMSFTAPAGDDEEFVVIQPYEEAPLQQATSG